MIAGVTTGPEDEQARKDARWAAYQARSRRSRYKVQVALAPLWVAMAVLWGLNEGADPLLRWAWAVLGALHVGLGVRRWRQLREPAPAPLERREAPGR